MQRSLMVGRKSRGDSLGSEAEALEAGDNAEPLFAPKKGPKGL